MLSEHSFHGKKGANLPGNGGIKENTGRFGGRYYGFWYRTHKMAVKIGISESFSSQPFSL
jgi:hypothetical protein